MTNSTLMHQRHDRRFNLELLHRRWTIHCSFICWRQIYVFTSQQDIFILNANNKWTKLATFTTSSSNWSSHTIANGRLYIGCNDWNLYCISNGTSFEASIPSQNITSISILEVVIASIVTMIIVTIVASYVIRKSHIELRRSLKSSQT